MTEAVATPQASLEAEAGEPAKRDWQSHPINLRLSLPTPFGRFYLTVVGGQERRSEERRIAERRKHPLDTLANLAFLFCLGLVSATSLVVMIYIMLVHALGWSGALVTGGL